MLIVRRASAYLLDALILGVISVGGLLVTVFFDVNWNTLDCLIVLAANLIYFTATEGAVGASWGKRALRLRVLKSSGSSVHWPDIVVRTSIFYVGPYFLYLTFEAFRPLFLDELPHPYLVSALLEARDYLIVSLIPLAIIGAGGAVGIHDLVCGTQVVAINQPAVGKPHLWRMIVVVSLGLVAIWLVIGGFYTSMFRLEAENILHNGAIPYSLAQSVEANYAALKSSVSIPSGSVHCIRATKNAHHASVEADFSAEIAVAPSTIRSRVDSLRFAEYAASQLPHSWLSSQPMGFQISLSSNVSFGRYNFSINRRFVGFSTPSGAAQLYCDDKLGVIGEPNSLYALGSL
jgi:uncharacterized RDD family membrane protein YckC